METFTARLPLVPDDEIERLEANRAARPFDLRRAPVGDPVVRDAPVPLLVHDAHFEPGEMGAETPVHADPETDVRVVSALEVDLIRFWTPVFVPVRDREQ